MGGGRPLADRIGKRLGQLFQPGFGIPKYGLAVANKEGVEVELVRKTCTPCRGGVPPLTPEEVGSYLPQASGRDRKGKVRRGATFLTAYVCLWNGTTATRE